MAGKRSGGGGDRELPGVMPDVVKIPILTRAMGVLKRARAEYQKAGMDAKEAGDRMRTLMHEHEEKLKTADGSLYYTSGTMTVTLKPGKEQIVIKVDEMEPPDAIEDDGEAASN